MYASVYTHVKYTHTHTHSNRHKHTHHHHHHRHDTHTYTHTRACPCTCTRIRTRTHTHTHAHTHTYTHTISRYHVMLQLPLNHPYLKGEKKTFPCSLEVTFLYRLKANCSFALANFFTFPDDVTSKAPRQIIVRRMPYWICIADFFVL